MSARGFSRGFSHPICSVPELERSDAATPASQDDCGNYHAKRVAVVDQGNGRRAHEHRADVVEHTAHARPQLMHSHMSREFHIGRGEEDDEYARPQVEDGGACAYADIAYEDEKGTG